MPLPTSGSLSLNDIHLEVGGDNQDLCGMNDPDFRLLVNKGDKDQQSIIEYRGKSAAFENSEASFFFTVAPIENGTWTLPGRSGPDYSSDNIDGHANPKHMIPATQVDDNEYLCTNHYENNHPTTVGNKLFLANMDRSRNISWAKEYTTSGDLAVGARTFPNQRLQFDPKMFKLGGNYYAIVYPRYFTNIELIEPYDAYPVGYDFAAGVCKFNSSGGFEWCRYINIETGLPTNATPNVERKGLEYAQYGQGHMFDKDGYVYLSMLTTVGDIYDTSIVSTGFVRNGLIKLYLYKISLLTGNVEDTIALSATNVPPPAGILVITGYSNYGVGAHEDDPSKIYLWMQGDNSIYYWEVDKSGSSMSLSTEKRISFDNINDNRPFRRVSSPVWLPNNKIKVFAQETDSKAGGISGSFVINKSTGNIQYNTVAGNIFSDVSFGITVNENNDVIFIGGLSSEVNLTDTTGDFVLAQSLVARAPANATYTADNEIFFAERYVSQQYGSYEGGFVGFLQGRVYHMGNIESTSQDGDFVQFTTQYGVFSINKNNLSSNVGTYGTNKYRFIDPNNLILDNPSYPGAQFTIQNTAFFSLSNSVAPTVFSTSVLSTGSNFTPTTPGNTGGDTL